MNHQTYEEWLFYDPESPYEELSNKNLLELEEHLKGCLSCRLLKNAWNEVEVELNLVPQLSPEPDFTGRWLKRLDKINQYESRKQAVRVFLFALLGISALVGMLIILLWPLISSPYVVFWSVYDRFINIYSLAYIVLTSITALFNTTIRYLPLSLWIFLIGIVFELGVIWIVSYRVLTLPRRITP
jgi:hypothetical protein